MTTLIPNRIEPRHEDLNQEMALVNALREKDPQACETLIREFGGQMLATARRYFPCDQDCADAVQEAFISAFQAIHRFEGQSRLGTWLHRIVVNACLMKIRGRSRRHEVSIDELLPTFDKSGHHARPVRGWKRGSEDQLLREESRALVRQCIDLLPDDYRAVIVLRDIEEYNTEQAAEMLNTTPGAIKTRLHRARQALRALLEPQFTDG